MHNSASTRAFTHADIVTFFHETFGTLHNPVYALAKVSLLPEIASGGWSVAYTITYAQPYGQTHYAELVIIQLTRDDGTPYLNTPKQVDLPTEKASTQEEDAEIEHQRQIQLAAYRKQWEQQSLDMIS